MALLRALATMMGNLGTVFEVLVCFLIFMAGLIFYAQDFKLGTVLHFAAYSATFLWFHAADLNWSIPLILALIFFVVMCLTLYAVNKATQQGQFI